jgi:hypothetical protein
LKLTLGGSPDHLLVDPRRARTCSCILRGHYPARIVVHKSSNFSADEIDGLTRAASDLRIDTVDLVTVMDSKLRLF